MSNITGNLQSQMNALYHYYETTNRENPHAKSPHVMELKMLFRLVKCKSLIKINTLSPPM